MKVRSIGNKTQAMKFFQDYFLTSPDTGKSISICDVSADDHETRITCKNDKEEWCFHIQIEEK